MTSSLERKKLTNQPDSITDEFIINAVSCATNLLFFDSPGNKEVFDNKLRLRIFKAVRLFVLETSNEELQIEAVRVLSNLSRHVPLCEEFVNDKLFIEALVLILDHT
jgi:hypothetical protein